MTATAESVSLEPQLRVPDADVARQGESDGVDPMAAVPARDLEREWLAQCSVAERVRLLELLADSLAGADRDEAGAPVGCELTSVSVRTHRVIERLTGVRLRWLDQIESDGLWAADRAFRSFPSYVAAHHDIPRSDAARQVQLARRLRSALPETGAALRAGTITLAKARTLAHLGASSDARVAALGQVAEIDEVESDETESDQAVPNEPDSDTTESGSGGEDELAADAAGGAAGAGTPGRQVTVEGVLLRHGALLRAEDFTTVVRQFAAVADPDACERGFREASEREFLSLARTTDGFHLAGFLTEASGQFVRARLSAIVETFSTDGRSHQQKMAQALTALARSDDGGGRSMRAQVGVTMSLSDLERLGLPTPGTANELGAAPSGVLGGAAVERTVADGAGRARGADAAEPSGAAGRAARGGALERSAGRPLAGRPLAGRPLAGRPLAGTERSHSVGECDDRGLVASALATPPTWFDGTGPVPDPVLRDLLDSADVYRVVLGPDSEIIDVGRTSRFFPRRMRNAIISRDGGCTFPDCHLPAIYCEVHHVVPWCHGGRTSVRNGALLCGYHNRLLDQKLITMT